MESFIFNRNKYTSSHNQLALHCRCLSNNAKDGTNKGLCKLGTQSWIWGQRTFLLQNGSGLNSLEDILLLLTARHCGILLSWFSGIFSWDGHLIGSLNILSKFSLYCTSLHFVQYWKLTAIPKWLMTLWNNYTNRSALHHLKSIWINEFSDMYKEVYIGLY